MKTKKLIYLVLGIGFLLSAISCSSIEEYRNPNDIKNDERDYVTMGHLNITPLNISRSENIANEFAISFKDDHNISILDFGVMAWNDKALFGCDADGDSNIDFFVKFLNTEMTEFYYIDSQKNILQKCSFIQNGDEFKITVLEIYTNRGVLSSRAESWSQCFERRMGSTLGITMMVIAGLSGGVTAGAVAIGGALSCAIWTPF